MADARSVGLSTEQSSLRRPHTQRRNDEHNGRRLGRPFGLALVVCLALAFAACSPRGFTWPEVDSDGWSLYRNDAIGYSLQLPDVCQIEEQPDGREVLVRFRGAPIVALRFVDESEAEARGLWIGHPPTGETELGGRRGQRYHYDHWDGPFGMRTMSHVVPHRDRYLGVELRTGEAEPTTTQRVILDSLTFES